MRCTTVRMTDGVTTIVCGRDRLHKCWVCGRLASWQCDAPVGRKDWSGRVPTCDRWLCADHRTKGERRNTDYCAEHAKQLVLGL